MKNGINGILCFLPIYREMAPQIFLHLADHTAQDVDQFDEVVIIGDLPSEKRPTYLREGRLMKVDHINHVTSLEEAITKICGAPYDEKSALNTTSLIGQDILFMGAPGDMAVLMSRIFPEVREFEPTQIFPRFRQKQAVAVFTEVDGFKLTVVDAVFAQPSAVPRGDLHPPVAA